jgi:hypothetical protein
VKVLRGKPGIAIKSDLGCIQTIWLNFRERTKCHKIHKNDQVYVGEANF